MFGLALAGFLALEAVLASGDRRAAIRRWAPFVAAAAVAVLLTPNGIEAVLQPIRLVNMPVLQANFVEWQPPDFRHPQLVEFWILLALFVGLASGAKVPVLRAVLTVGILHMAIQHVRHADLLGLVVPLAVAGSLGPHLASLVKSDHPSFLTRGATRLAPPAKPAGLVLAIAFGGLAAAVSIGAPINREDSGTTPASALAAARAQHVSGPVFNDEGFGGYLVFQHVPTFIDGRMEMYGDDFLDRYLAAEAGKDPQLKEVLDQYHIAWTLLTPGSGAVKALDHMAGWHRAYEDKTAVVHVKDGHATDGT
jgi:hypothetical protein